MLAAALQAEVAAYVDQFGGVRDEDVLGALPKSAHPGAKKALAEIWNAEDKDHARAAGERQAHRSGNGAADAVLLGDPAAVGA